MDSMQTACGRGQKDRLRECADPLTLKEKVHTHTENKPLTCVR